MSGIKIGRMVLGWCQTNCYFLYKEEQKKENGMIPVIFADPADQGKAIYQALQKNGFEVAAILLTHGHFDHILGAQELRGASGARIYAYAGEDRLLKDSGLNLSAGNGVGCTVKVNAYLRDQEKFSAAGMECRVIATPGHTEGSCCFYFEESGILVAGDTLFAESVGRTDFPTGSMSALMRSVKERLFVLPDETKVYPGHGDSTTIGWEKEHNPFF
ncbi:MAG: MBL fold metallo-hydrolase [Lachnospiraceae bacterium]|nr:MBL fold metallo-hydrolase [Lachnospiraceae bacterium]